MLVLYIHFEILRCSHMHESCQKKMSHLISRTKKILPPDMAVTVELAVSCESSTRDPVYKPHKTLWSSSTVNGCRLDISRSSERRLLHCTHPARTEKMELVVLIVGAGPAGLATAACLSQRSIPYLIVEREDCSASLWRYRTYDRVKLHLSKEFSCLPYMPHEEDTPTYIPKAEFLKYLDCYREHFGIKPRYCTSVVSAAYDEGTGRWVVAARDTVEGTEIRYAARFLVVATGENGAGRIPEIQGLESFCGEAIHSSTYKSGRSYAGRRVLVVGAGNSGMEIAYDLANHGADTSIVVRSPVCMFCLLMYKFHRFSPSSLLCHA